MTELVLCFGMWGGICSGIVVTKYQDYAACEAERKVQLASAQKLSYALCRPVVLKELK